MRMSATAAVLICGFLITGCTDEERAQFRSSLAVVRSTIADIRSGVASIEDAVRDLCRPGADGSPGLIPRLNASATTIACLRDASRQTKDGIAQFARFGQAFCDNPNSKSLSQMATYAAVGLAIASSTKAEKCP